MKKGRGESGLKETEWTSLVDIIFQLLIYFMVTLALGTVEEQATSEVQGKEQENLPKLPPVTKLADVQQLTEGYLLHIDKGKKKYKGDLVGYLLDPQVNSVKKARKESLNEHGPWPLDKARRELEDKIEEELYLNNSPPPVEIRAHKEVEFGYILDIMRFCYQDSIESVNFHFAKLQKK